MPRAPPTASDPRASLLHKFCRVLLSSVNLVRSCVCHSDMREEEDFVTFSFGLPLEDTSKEDCVAELQAAERVLSDAALTAGTGVQLGTAYGGIFMGALNMQCGKVYGGANVTTCSSACARFRIPGRISLLSCRQPGGC